MVWTPTRGTDRSGGARRPRTGKAFGAADDVVGGELRRCKAVVPAQGATLD